MAKVKDELITQAELARRLKVSAPYIAKKKEVLKSCKYGKKYYFKKSALALGRNPDKPHTSYQQENNKKEIPKSTKNWNIHTPKNGMKEIEKLLDIKENEKKLNKEVKAKAKKKSTLEVETIQINGKDLGRLEDFKDDKNNEDAKDEATTLLSQILEAVRDTNTTKDYTKLNGLKTKASIIKEYFLAENEKIKNKKLQDNLFEKEDVVKIISFAVHTIRNSLINMPNNYAVNLVGMEQKSIKEYVTDDVNKILEDFTRVGEQFE